MNNMIKALKLLFSIFKPDFRNTTGWLLISSGLLLISPNVIQDIILNLLKTQNIYTSESFDNSRVIGALLISAGIHYHLLLVASNSKNEKLEVGIAISLLLLLPAMIYLSM